MNCPFCAALDTKVIDSRLIYSSNEVRRRRECLTCCDRFTTYEKVELVMPRVVKRDGSRCQFDEVKLRAGLMKSIEKRPVATDVLDHIIVQVVDAAHKLGEREVTTIWIGQRVMHLLRAIDQVAYVRFASVYRRFNDAGEFQAVIDDLIEEGKPVVVDS